MRHFYFRFLPSILSAFNPKKRLPGFMDKTGQPFLFFHFPLKCGGNGRLHYCFQQQVVLAHGRTRTYRAFKRKDEKKMMDKELPHLSRFDLIDIIYEL